MVWISDPRRRAVTSYEVIGTKGRWHPGVGVEGRRGKMAIVK
jgi:hypothetical protein